MMRRDIKKGILCLMAVIVLIFSVGCGAEPGGDSSDGNEKVPLEGELTEILGGIYKITGIDEKIAVETHTVNLSDSDSLKYYTGLEDATAIKEAVASESLISSQAYSLVLVRVNNSDDIKEIEGLMKEGVDPQKWICVIADDLKTAYYDDVILLIMVSTAMEDVATTKDVIDAFNEICDKGLGQE